MSLRSVSVNPREAKAHIVRRVFIPYDAIVQDVKKHKGTVVFQIKRQAANRAEKVLTKRVGFRVVAYPYFEDGSKGYLFVRPEDVDEH